jgi:lipid A 3-O-deacylase
MDSGVMSKFIKHFTNKSAAAPLRVSFGQLFIPRVSFLLSLIVLLNSSANGQENKRLVRVSMDNDFFAFRKEDGAYTNGLRLDFFYATKKRSSVPSIFIGAGEGSLITTDFGIMQVMITPNEIRDIHPPEGDYPYSGSLFGMVSVNSINKQRTKSVTTEYVAGVIGPASLAGQTQIGFHRLAGFVRPVGWDTQYPTTLFTNINISAEELLASVHGRVEWIVGGELQLGTMRNSARVQSIIRIGKMNPYFSGVIKRFSAKNGAAFQLYLSLKPYAQFVAHDALLEGTVLHSQNAGTYDMSELIYGIQTPKRFVSQEIYGGEVELVTIFHSVGLSVGYKGSTALLQHQPFKVYGNISLYCAL